MADITLRSVKAQALTADEVDDNFKELQRGGSLAFPNKGLDTPIFLVCSGQSLLNDGINDEIQGTSSTEPEDLLYDDPDMFHWSYNAGSPGWAPFVHDATTPTGYNRSGWLDGQEPPVMGYITCGLKLDNYFGCATWLALWLRKTTGRKVYLLKIQRNGTGISEWEPNVGRVEIELQAQITACLASPELSNAGITKADVVCYFQATANASSTGTIPEQNQRSIDFENDFWDFHDHAQGTYNFRRSIEDPPRSALTGGDWSSTEDTVWLMLEVWQYAWPAFEGQRRIMRKANSMMHLIGTRQFTRSDGFSHLGHSAARRVGQIATNLIIQGAVSADSSIDDHNYLDNLEAGDPHTQYRLRADTVVDYVIPDAGEFKLSIANETAPGTPLAEMVYDATTDLWDLDKGLLFSGGGAGTGFAIKDTDSGVLAGYDADLFYSRCPVLVQSATDAHTEYIFFGSVLDDYEASNYIQTDAAFGVMARYGLTDFIFKADVENSLVSVFADFAVLDNAGTANLLEVDKSADRTSVKGEFLQDGIKETVTLTEAASRMLAEHSSTGISRRSRIHVLNQSFQTSGATPADIAATISIAEGDVYHGKVTIKGWRPAGGSAITLTIVDALTVNYEFVAQYVTGNWVINYSEVSSTHATIGTDMIMFNAKVIARIKDPVADETWEWRLRWEWQDTKED